MQVNSVTLYSQQSLNYLNRHSNVNFGKSKVVCKKDLREIFDAPIKLFEQAKWSEELGQKYNYEAHFEVEVPEYDPLSLKADTYKMTLKPYKYSLKEKFINLFKKTLPVLPCELEFSSQSLADVSLQHFDNIVGLTTKINSINTEKITEMIDKKLEALWASNTYYSID